MQVDMHDLRAELQRHKDDRGLNHVTSSRLADEMDYSAQELGAALSEAEDRGWVVQVGRSLRATWRIEL